MKKRKRRTKQEPETMIVRFEFDLDKSLILVPGYEVVNSSFASKTEKWVVWIKMPVQDMAPLPSCYS